MRLSVARLCLDCEEVHAEGQCPVCGSESFGFLTRWVRPEVRATPESVSNVRRAVPPPDRQEAVQTYRELLDPERRRNRGGQLLTRGALGLAILGLARLVWRSGAGDTIDQPSGPSSRR
jgi:predicted nucleic acid-binding Zn ribbon protein